MFISRPTKRTKNIGWLIAAQQEQELFDKETPQEKAKNTIDNLQAKEHIIEQWCEDSANPEKLRTYYQELLAEFEEGIKKENHWPKNVDIIPFNICAGIIAGKLQQEFNTTYMCQLADRVFETGGLLERTPLSQILEAEIKIEVKKTNGKPELVTIGIVSPSPKTDDD